MWWCWGGEDGEIGEMEDLQRGPSSHIISPTWRGDGEMLGGFSASPKGLLWSKEAPQHLQKLPKVALSWVLVASGASEWQMVKAHYYLASDLLPWPLPAPAPYPPPSRTGQGDFSKSYKDLEGM